MVSFFWVSLISWTSVMVSKHGLQSKWNLSGRSSINRLFTRLLSLFLKTITTCLVHQYSHIVPGI